MSTTTKSPRKRRRRSFGQVFRRPGGPGWLARYPDPHRRAVSGRTRYVTRSVNSRAEGEALLKEVRKAILLGRYAPAEPEAAVCDLTLLQAIDEFIAAKCAEGRSANGVRRYETSRAAIARSPLAGHRVADIGPRDLERYMAWRRKRRWIGVRKKGAKRTDANVIVLRKGDEVSNSSVNRDLALISAAVGRLIRLGQLDKNPVACVKRPKEPTKTRAVLSKEECAHLLEACDPHLRVFCLAALLTGARPCELRAVTWGDISFGNRTITIFRSKVGEGDAIPLHPELTRELKALRKRRATKGKRVVPDDEPVFLSSKGCPNFDHRWSWKKALKKAGLHRRKGLTLYSLRHSFATHYLERGSPSDLQQLLGHASYVTTERYVRSVGERARAGIEALDVGRR
jgi:integrase